MEDIILLTLAYQRLLVTKSRLEETQDLLGHQGLQVLQLTKEKYKLKKMIFNHFFTC